MSLIHSSAFEESPRLSYFRDVGTAHCALSVAPLSDEIRAVADSRVKRHGLSGNWWVPASMRFAGPGNMKSLTVKSLSPELKASLTLNIGYKRSGLAANLQDLTDECRKSCLRWPISAYTAFSIRSINNPRMNFGEPLLLFSPEDIARFELKLKRSATASSMPGYAWLYSLSDIENSQEVLDACPGPAHGNNLHSPIDILSGNEIEVLYNDTSGNRFSTMAASIWISAHSIHNGISLSSGGTVMPKLTDPQRRPTHWSINYPSPAYYTVQDLEDPGMGYFRAGGPSLATECFFSTSSPDDGTTAAPSAAASTAGNVGTVDFVAGAESCAGGAPYDDGQHGHDLDA